MPKIGEIRKNKHSQDQIWQACERCGIERWVVLIFDSPTHRLCRRCSHLGHVTPLKTRLKISKANKGRPYKSRNKGRMMCAGYVKVRVSPDSDFYPMTDKQGYSLEHRIIYAQYLGRCLQSWEIIHHKDGVRDNNSLDNLELTTTCAHLMETKNSVQVAYERGFQDGIKVRNDELIKEIRLMRWQLKQLIGEHKLLE